MRTPKSVLLRSGPVKRMSLRDIPSILCAGVEDNTDVARLLWMVYAKGRKIPPFLVFFEGRGNLSMSVLKYLFHE